MAESLLTQLRTMTTIVADRGDIESVLRFKPQDGTTNPSLIAAAANLPQYSSLVDGVLCEAIEQSARGTSDKDVANLAFRHLAVAFGKLILNSIPGRVSTEVDARLSCDREATLAQARDVIQQYESAGVSRQRVLIKKPRPGRVVRQRRSSNRTAYIATLGCFLACTRPWLVPTPR